jgi:hypothetical protein
VIKHGSTLHKLSLTAGEADKTNFITAADSDITIPNPGTGIEETYETGITGFLNWDTP